MEMQSSGKTELATSQAEGIHRFRVPSWYEEKRITNSDAEGLSEFRAYNSNSIPIWCTTALRF